MTTREVFRKITGLLDHAGIAYMVTGSFAGSYHGAPRATQDIDIVIAAEAGQLRSLASSLPASEYYFDLEAALKALQHERLFNIVDRVSGWKIDLIIRKSRPFSRAEFDRRTLVDLDGVPLYVASPEDVVIAKLEWGRKGGSDRQVQDAAAILRARGADLDLAYIERWVRDLGLGKEWNAARSAAAGETE